MRVMAKDDVKAVNVTSLAVVHRSLRLRQFLTLFHRPSAVLQQRMDPVSSQFMAR
jgi:hypothetical protein